MNQCFRLLVIILGTAIALSGCAALSGVPEGSVLVGVYEGSFTGKFFWGTIQVKVYETPGSLLRQVSGWIEQEAEPGSYLNFQGALKGSRFEGQFTVVNGNISGELSSDGGLVTGVYNFTDWPFDHGTWNARKK
ncbi:MAG: hypothetical protein HY895_07100 [Deltaproteobacteria bacterium]|nr:hypothetical protein [Deltaproteobacteria bacterium]